jgi:phosphatidylglycerol lysyltransferase
MERAAALVRVGAERVRSRRDWSAVLACKASLRQQLNRARNKNVCARPWPVERAERHPDLEHCLRQWLATRGLPPMHFLTEWHLLARLLDRRVFVAERDGQAVGFLVAAPVPLRDGWLVEQIIRGAAAPNGTAELLLDGAMRAFAAEGAGYVTLGLAPLSRVASSLPPPPPWSVRLLLGWARLHGRRFYNFRGLEHFKSKFQPERWEPLYAVADRGRVSLGMLYAIAGAFSGGSPPRLILRALLRAAGQECRWAAARLRSGRV